ncbi:unnamed protein product [Prunus brigantina]
MAGVEGQNENDVSDVSDSIRIMLAILGLRVKRTSPRPGEPGREICADNTFGTPGGIFLVNKLTMDPRDKQAIRTETSFMAKFSMELRAPVAPIYIQASGHGPGAHLHSGIGPRPDVEIANWVAFETIFMEKYFPETMKTMKVREFTNLYQGDMTVGQYQAKFEELMHFDPYIIPDEFAKVKKFEEGLRLEVKEKVELFKLKKYAEVVDRALMAEQMILSSKRVFEPKNPNGGQSSKRQRFFPSCSRYQKPRSFVATENSGFCCHCRQIGHYRRDCPKLQSY